MKSARQRTHTPLSAAECALMNAALAKKATTVLVGSPPLFKRSALTEFSMTACANSAWEAVEHLYKTWSVLEAVRHAERVAVSIVLFMQPVTLWVSQKALVPASASKAAEK